MCPDVARVSAVAVGWGHGVRMRGAGCSETKTSEFA